MGSDSDRCSGLGWSGAPRGTYRSSAPEDIQVLTGSLLCIPSSLPMRVCLTMWAMPR